MANRQWEEFLNPSVLRPRLINAAVYISSFELLKERLVNRIREFMYIADEGKERYEKEVLSRNRSPVYASLDWLQEMEAITEDDLSTFNEVKKCRNELAHELLDLISGDGLPDEMPVRYADLIALLNKIEMWWIREFEMPVNPDYDGEEIQDKDIHPGPVIGLKILLDVATGSEEESERYLQDLP